MPSTKTALDTGLLKGKQLARFARASWWWNTEFVMKFGLAQRHAGIDSDIDHAPGRWGDVAMCCEGFTGIRPVLQTERCHLLL
mmetsp:Transcript_73926/g.128205  ORF Transcript_73926/g.128205 Transcript_73926/m.128205 type:complete len:83 (+) Transcript_73926:513-761(+)